MSTYGRDSWEPEAMHRKNRVNEVLANVHLLDRYSNRWNRLSNGRIACLVCLHRPILDTFPMLIIYRKGEKHQAAAVKQGEKEFCLQNEIQKRTALEASKATEIVRKHHSSSLPTCSPLLEATPKRTTQALAIADDSKMPCNSSTCKDAVPYTKHKISQGMPFFSATSSQISTQPIKVVKTSANAPIQQSNSGKWKKMQNFEIQNHFKMGIVKPISPQV